MQSDLKLIGEDKFVNWYKVDSSKLVDTLYYYVFRRPAESKIPEVNLDKFYVVIKVPLNDKLHYYKITSPILGTIDHCHGWFSGWLSGYRTKVNEESLMMEDI